MQTIVKVSESRELTVKGQTVGRFKMNVFLSHGTDNTDIVPTDIDFTKVFLKATLTRGGKDNEIYSGAVIFPVIASHLDNNLNYCHPLNTSAANMVIVRAKGATTKEQAIVTAVIDLPGVINVKDSDVLTCELQVGSGAFASDIDSAVSYVELEIENFIGVEASIPRIKVFPINASESSFSPNIGDDLVKICFINLDKDSILEADSPLNTVNLSGDKGAWNYSFRQLLARRYYDEITPTNAAYLRHSHVVYQGVELDNVDVNFQLVSANVASGKNAVVAYYLNADAETFERAIEMQEKHAERNVTKVLRKGTKNVANRVNDRIKGLIKRR